MSMLDVTLSAGGRLPLELPRTHNAMAVVVGGRVHAGGQTAHAGELLLFAHDGERLDLHADEDSHVLILAGEPIDEPVVQYGPFVMNSFDEIRQAVEDVNRGGFGPIPTD
jgi:redox-sensitive bicupin YhaK (pirin superfamily)